MTDVQSIIDGLSVQAGKYKSGTTVDNNARWAMINAAHQLINELETPAEFVVRSTWVDYTRNTAMRIALDLDVFNQLISASSEQGLSSADLAKPTNAQPELVDRVMRALAANLLVREIGADRYAANQKTHMFAEEAYGCGIRVVHDLGLTALDALHHQVKELGFKSPDTFTSTPFNRAFDTDLGFYVWMLKKRPDLGLDFMKFMTHYRAGTPKWWHSEFYPVQERLPHPDLTDKTPLIVDMAGGLGHDLQEFLKMHGQNLPGSMHLEDVPEVIGGAQASGMLDKRIECLTFDLFQPQPIQGARVYHMHSILHNWPDKECHDILNNLTPAMKKGFSKLLIFECVIPEKGAKASQMAEDMLMSLFFSARERSPQQWEALLKPHGLKITGIWTSAWGEESVVEAELVD